VTAAIIGEPREIRSWSDFAGHFTRSIAQTEALQRYRGKGQQKVTVEHVHVHTGKQAIVGAVNHPGGGGK
jgi:hypothetical protein